MVVEITKETCEKCGIETVKYHNEEKNIIESWHKMNDIETKLGHSNIDDVVLERIRKYCGKKTKDITKEEKEKYKAFFEGEGGVFIIEKLTCDIIERCKLPKAIELRKKLRYNHNDVMVLEETSIAEKMLKLFPHERIALNKNFNNRKPDMFKSQNFKTFQCNPNDPNFDLLKFLGEINLYILKLCEKKWKLKR